MRLKRSLQQSAGKSNNNVQRFIVSGHAIELHEGWDSSPLSSRCDLPGLLSHPPLLSLSLPGSSILLRCSSNVRSSRSQSLFHRKGQSTGVLREHPSRQLLSLGRSSAWWNCPVPMELTCDSRAYRQKNDTCGGDSLFAALQPDLCDSPDRDSSCYLLGKDTRTDGSIPYGKPVRGASSYGDCHGGTRSRNAAWGDLNQDTDDQAIPLKIIR